MTTPSCDVSIIIPVKDHARVLPACLAAIAAQTIARGVEVILVDNHEHFEPDRYAGCSSGRFPLRIEHEPRPGSYSARNRGLLVARGRLCAFTDADCLPQPGWLDAGVTAIDAGSGVAGGEVIMTYRDASHPTLAERFDSAYYLDQRRYVETCGFAATANLFVRRDLFERVGLFDARLRSGGDKDWCLRAAQCGVSVIYAPDACVWHPARATWGEVWRKAWRIEQGQRPSTNVSLSVGIGGLLRHCRSVAASLRHRGCSSRRIVLTLSILCLLHGSFAARRRVLAQWQRCRDRKYVHRGMNEVGSPALRGGKEDSAT